MDFREISYLIIFRNYVEEIQALLTSDKNDGHVRWRPIYVYNHISFTSFWSEKSFGKIYSENANTHFILMFFGYKYDLCNNVNYMRKPEKYR